MGTNVTLTAVSRNRKTGPIPVSTSGQNTCPDSCPFKKTVCYAASGPLRLVWDKVTRGDLGTDWDGFLGRVKAIPRGQIWRHNQAGDLPGEGDTLDLVALAKLVEANKGRRGFTYTHKPMDSPETVEAIRAANAGGFTVNLSANDLQDADRLLDLDCAPVVCVLPANVQGNVTVKTPKGRRVVVCPATYRDDVTCATCGLCQRAERKVAVGFPVHGTGAKHYSVGG